MGRGAARTLRRLLWVALTLVALAGAGAGLWALRPIPAFSSDGVATGSPFDVAFRIENSSRWVPMAGLRIGCVLSFVRGLGIEPTWVEAANVVLHGSLPGGLGPGDSGTFNCPFHAAVDRLARDDPGLGPKSEIFFRVGYDLPFLGWFRVADDSEPYRLNTRVLPPRWMAAPDGGHNGARRPGGSDP